MTWVKGTTTWGNLEHLLAQLACGEVADGSSTTVAAGSQWVREVTRSVTDGVLNSTTTITSATANFATTDVGFLVIGTGITLGTTIASVTNSTTAVLSAAATATASTVSLQICTNAIRTPASKDVSTGGCSNRTGYFLNVGNSTSSTTPMVLGSLGQSTACRVTTPFSSNIASGSLGRWYVYLRVSTPNSVSGNYSTAVISYNVFDADTGTSYGSSTAVPNAAGLTTLPSGLTCTITDPSGFLSSTTIFVRAFTGTYLYGIDAWPMWYRAATTSPTFSVAPPGVAGTDYDVVSITVPSTLTTNATTPVAFYGVIERSNMFFGLGIKSSTGLGSSPLYTVSFPMAFIKMRIFAASAGQLSLDYGASKIDSVNTPGTMRLSGGLRVTSWCKVFTTSGSVASTSAVQYWMSVTSDGIVLVLNGDTAATGKLGTAYICAFTPTDPTYDVFPVVFNHTFTDYTTDASTTTIFDPAVQYGYWSLRRRQDGSEGSRDWQTKWMRGEHLQNASGLYNTSGMLASGQDLISISNAPSTGSGVELTAFGWSGAPLSNQAVAAPMRQVKPAPDGKYWLYGFQYGEGFWAGNGSIVDENRFVRGAQNTRFLFIPSDGWGNGDDLLDSTSGSKYFLIQPDYCAQGMGRFRYATNSYFGGVAIAEL